MNKIIAYFICLCLAACDSSTNPYSNSMNIAPAVLAEMDTAHYTTIRWKDSVYNFGTVKSGDTVQVNYYFTNTGNTPLFIFNTRTTCGCTVTDFPKKPILPNRTGFISATFKSGTQTGNIDKNIIVIANTKTSKSSTLIIRGTVQTATVQHQ